MPISLIKIRSRISSQKLRRKPKMKLHMVRKFICWLFGHDWLYPMNPSNVKKFCNRCWIWEKIFEF